MKPQNKIILLIYLLVVFIWSTTPLAIKWSTSANIDYISSLVFRMMIGASLAIVIALSWYKTIPLNAQAIKVYFASSIGIYGAMMLVYWGSQFVSSGLISVIYGFTPIMTSILAYLFVLGEQITLSKIIGSLLGVVGLYFIFQEQLNLDQQIVFGLLAVIASAFFHALSAILIKKINYSIPALQLVAGGLGVSMPMFFLTYIFYAQPLPEYIHIQTLFSILYLGIVGSVIGFIGYYFILKHLQASTVTLITLITPVCALYLGNSLNHEQLSFNILWGTGFILLGLAIHQLYPYLKNMYFSSQRADLS